MEEMLTNGDPVLECRIARSRERIEQQMSFIAKQKNEAKAEEQIRCIKAQIIDLNAKITQIELADTTASIFVSHPS